MKYLPVWARIAMRELRGGLSGFRVFLLCLALGVAAIAAVGSVREAIERGLSADGAALLGGDAQVSFTYRFATDEERAWMAANAVAVSEIADFRSLVTTDAPPETRERSLAQVKAVDGAYPLYGSIGLAPEIGIAAALAGADGLAGMAIAPVLAERLGVAPGDVLRLGERPFRVMALITREPDPSQGGFGFAPTVIVERAALEGSGLLGQGTVFNSAYRLALPEGADLAALAGEARARFADTGLRWRDRRDGAPEVRSFVNRLGAFLVLVGLAGLAVGGVGVAAAVRAYLEGKVETIATLKTLGATSGTVFAIYLAQIGVLAAFGIAAGAALGGLLPALLGPPLAAGFPLPALWGFYLAPLGEAALYGVLAALLFSIWPLARAVDLRAARLFRDLTDRARAWPRLPYVVVTVALAALLVGAAAAFSGLAVLALWAAAGIVAALFVLAIAAFATRLLARRLARARLSRGRPALRLALGAVAGPGGETASVILSLGLGLSVLATIGQIDSNLRSALENELPARAPAFFFVDIQPDQVAQFADLTTGSGLVEELDTAPMLRGILTRINGRPAAEVAGGHWILRGDRGVTYAATPPQGTTLTAGSWWPADYAGPPQVSFAAEEAAELGLGLGDEVTVNILGRDITATITSLRVVDFSTMGINFIMVMNPSALAGAPHTMLATAYAPPGREGAILRAVGNALPNVTAISVREGLERARENLGALTNAIRWAASATLLTGFVVLIGAAAAGERKRTYEAAILKTLGAVRARILASFALRSALLGGAAGGVALAAGALAAWGVLTFVMEVSYRFDIVSALAIVAGGALASLLAGLAFAWRSLSVRPARVLRARD